LDDWRSAYITPLFKKGDKAKASNYRPVSLTSLCCKVIKHVIHSQVMKHLEVNNTLTDQQHSFRKHHTCESQLITTLMGLHDKQQMTPSPQTSARLLTRFPIIELP
jgi:hypothetical protein